MTDRWAAAPPRVAVLADDLIWATRLVDALRRCAAEPVSIRSAVAFEATLPSVVGALVDLTARAYDGLACLRAASAAGVPSVAVGQHDDAPLRRSAREAGAAKVYAYRALFEHGDRELGAWVAGLGREGADGRDRAPDEEGGR